MDDLKLHNGEQDDTGDGEHNDTKDDKKQTPPESKETAEQVKEKQKTAWLNNIKSGKKTLEDMPANLDWLKKEILPELGEAKKPVNVSEDDITLKVRMELVKERELEEKRQIVRYMEEGNLTDEQMDDVREEYADLRSDGISEVKALKRALRYAGVKDINSIIEDRKREGMTLSPDVSMPRRILKKSDGLTDMERKFVKNLPPGFKL
jgi:hypothetical protein